MAKKMEFLGIVAFSDTQRKVLGGIYEGTVAAMQQVELEVMSRSIPNDPHPDILYQFAWSHLPESLRAEAAIVGCLGEARGMVLAIVAATVKSGLLHISDTDWN